METSPWMRGSNSKNCVIDSLSFLGGIMECEFLDLDICIVVKSNSVSGLIYIVYVRA